MEWMEILGNVVVFTVIGVVGIILVVGIIWMYDDIMMLRHRKKYKNFPEYKRLEKMGLKETLEIRFCDDIKTFRIGF